MWICDPPQMFEDLHLVVLPSKSEGLRGGSFCLVKPQVAGGGVVAAVVFFWVKKAKG